MAWIVPVVSALATAYSAYSSSQKKNESGGETVTADQMIPAFQRQTGQDLANWISKYMGNYAPGEDYTGKLSAGMTGQEKTGQGILDQYLSAPNTGGLFQQSQKQIEDTLAGKYADPNASPFIKAMKQVSDQDLQDAINQSRRGAGARGKFFSTASLGEEKDLANRNLQSLNSVIGGFMQNERQNQLNAVPLANSMDQYSMQGAPLAKVQASQTYGSLTRTLEQADLERQYNDYLRKRSEMAQPITAAQSMYGTRSDYGIPSWQMPQQQGTDSLSSILSAIMPLMSMFGGSGSKSGTTTTNYGGGATGSSTPYINNFKYS